MTEGPLDSRMRSHDAQTATAHAWPVTLASAAKFNC